MKNKLKNSSNPDSRTLHPGRLFWHIFRLTGFALALSSLLALFALLVVGLPPSLTHRITAKVREAGIPLQMQSIRLSTHRGWVLSDARLYSTSPDDLQPLLSAKKLYVMVWPVNWKKPVEGGWHIKIYVRDLSVSLGRPWEVVLPETHPFRTVSKLEAQLTAAHKQIAVESAHLQWGSLTITAKGEADFHDAAAAPGSRETGPQLETDFRRIAAKAADALSRLQCEQPPQLDLKFNFDKARPDKTFLEADLEAGGIVLRDRVYRKLSGEFGYRDNTWTLSTLQLERKNREQLVLHGAFNLTTSNAQVAVENTLSAADLFSLLPEEAQSAVAQTGVKPYGRFDFTASAGPAPYELLAEKVNVQVQKAQIKRENITLDPLALTLVRNGSRIELPTIQARVNGGPFSGNFKIDLDTKTWRAEAEIQSDPAPLCALADDADLMEFVGRFRFPGEQMKAHLVISQSPADEYPAIAGTLTGDRFSCGGVPIGHLETFMVYSNRVLDLAPLHITRGQEAFDGTVKVNFATELAYFDATNSFPPADIEHALAPGERTILDDFRFNGPVYAVGKGRLDYGSWTNHEFSGTFRAVNVGMEKIEAALFTGEVKGYGTQLLFTNATLQFYGGSAEGSAEFDIFLQDGQAPYRVNANVTRIDLEQLIKQISTTDNGRTRGQLSASLNFTADATAGFWKSVRGGGKVKIEDGRLAEVPLFGGFSRLTQTAFPGFNLFSLTAFSADYELHDGAIWSDNAQLGGTLVSARGRGSFSPETGLNFTVAAEPMRQTGGEKEKSQLQRLAANALKESTAPLFRLLEFKLEGPIEKPEWRFVNLPKEVSDLPKDVSGLLRRAKDKEKEK